MNVALTADGASDGVVRLRATLPPGKGARTLSYCTRTGALARIDGVVCGAFDAKHRDLPVSERGGELLLEVERSSLPASGLPAGDGLRWRLMLERASQTPARGAALAPVRAAPREPSAAPKDDTSLPLTGHSHLDVAWLWTYDEARRKALRTFATTVRQLESDPAFVFAQSQPQLYEFVRADDAAFFERVCEFARAGRIDAGVAAMWVEPDCNVPSGESLLRQLTHGVRFAERYLGTRPSVAWLPDSFGFANTLPTLLAHAGIAAFGTTKLSWNDTTVFPHAQFVWEGPDGSRVTAAMFASLEGEAKPSRIRAARERGEPLLLGHGDGGGGATDAMLAEAPALGTWTGLSAWFAALGARQAALPAYRDELYLEYHRGVFTTHHDLKARNAALERGLHDAELAGTWALALHASPFFLAEFRAQLGEAWEIVLRAQFHDVLPGTATEAAYAQVRAEYDRAEALVAQASANARSVLPRASEHVRRADTHVRPPAAEGDAFRFENGAVSALVARDGSIAELRRPGGINVAAHLNRLRAYRDTPAKWDAWNIDRGYADRSRAVTFGGCAVEDGGLHVEFAVGRSRGVMRLSLAAHEPWLRVEIAVEWRERHTLLRVENRLALQRVRARFGSPHGSVERTAYPNTPAERAKFEACGQRYARLDGAGGACAVLSLDTYGWSIAGDEAGTNLGHSLLRGSTWPDPHADSGEHALAYAFWPLEDETMGGLERGWMRFAGESAVPMFEALDPGVVIVATKPADDGDGAIVRARECDGIAVEARIACAARTRAVECVDALERPAPGTATLSDGTLAAMFEPYALRSFRVRLA